MPRQKGVFKVKGTLDDFSFYRSSQDGHLVRMKGGVDGDRIKNDPAYARTRENISEFGHAAKAGKLIRQAFRQLVNKAKDPRATARFQKLLMQVVQSDATNKRGERKVQDGDMSLLNGFNFNVNAELGKSLRFLYSVNVDRAAGEAVISIPDYTPNSQVDVPLEATHMKLLYGAAEIDHAAESYVSDLQEEAWHVIDDTAIAAASLTLAIPAGSTLPIYVVLGVGFGQEVNGQIYDLQNGGYNALSLVQVEV